MINFITGRIKAIFYSLKGAFLLLKTEHSIQAQSLIALVFIIAGFFFEISKIKYFTFLSFLLFFGNLVEILSTDHFKSKHFFAK